MADEGSGGGETDLAKGGRYLKKRIQSSSQIFMVLAAGIVVPMAVEHSNKKHAMHLTTVLCAYTTLFSGLSLCGLVSDLFYAIDSLGRRRYMAIKALVHVCSLLLVSISFSLSLMMRMYAVVTSLTLSASAALVAHRLWQCAATELEADVNAYMGCEGEIQQLVELSTNVTCMLFGGWFGVAFSYFQNYPEEARDARFHPSEYLTFFISAASSLMLLNAVPGKPAPDRAAPTGEGAQDSPPSARAGETTERLMAHKAVRDLMTSICAIVAGVVITTLVIASSKVGGYAAITLVPEGVALAAWCARRARGRWELPVSLQDWFRYSGGAAGQQGEPASHNWVSVSLALLLAVLTYRAKDVAALSLHGHHRRSCGGARVEAAHTAANAGRSAGGSGRGQGYWRSPRSGC